MSRSAKLMNIKDFGGESSGQQKAKKSSTKVAKSEARTLVIEYRAIADQIKQLEQRREALKAEIIRRVSPSSQKDEKGNLLSVVGKFSVKQEIRRRITALPYAQLDKTALKLAKRYKLYKDVTDKILDEELVGELLENEVLTEDDLRLFMKIGESVALKIEEVEDDE